MMGMHHTNVPVHSDRHQEEGASGSVRCQHEEDNFADSRSKSPLHVEVVVACTEGQCQDEKKISHHQVEEQHCAALPGPQAAAEDTESQTISKESQNELCPQNWWQHADEQSAVEIAFHVGIFFFGSFAVYRRTKQNNLMGTYWQSLKGNEGGGVMWFCRFGIYRKFVSSAFNTNRGNVIYMDLLL